MQAVPVFGMWQAQTCQAGSVLQVMPRQQSRVSVYCLPAQRLHEVSCCLPLHHLVKCLITWLPPAQKNRRQMQLVTPS